MKKLATTVLLSVALACVGVVSWAVFLPASHPVLERAGLLAPMRALGLPVAEAPAASGGGGPGARGGMGAQRVIGQEVTLAEARMRIDAIGTARPLRSVILTSEVSGTLEEVFINSGDWVEEGSEIARLNTDVQQLALARAELGLRDAEARAARVAQLRQSGAATQVQIGEVDLAVSRAELDLRDAELELRRRQIIAPISGWIGIVTVEPGNQLAANAQIARMDDRSTLLMEFDVPEQFVGQIAVGDLLDVSPLSRVQDTLLGRVRALDARVDDANRTLRIQGEIDNEGDKLRPGMAFRISVPLAGEMLPVIDPLAIQWDRGGAFVWAVDSEGRAQRVAIEIVQRRDDAVLLRADLAEGQVVVLEGVQNLRPGAAVDVGTLRDPVQPAALDGPRAEAGAPVQPDI
ncbi:MAG: efflux RND transporter periplasmic adaptor subunit [Roseinatronobacter sp.]|nr:efflux RND transporter periplasmic adaptor subunit [Roseinatronobacter sp.]